MFLSENTQKLDDALKSGNQAEFNGAVARLLKELAAAVDALRLDMDEAGEKSEKLLSGYEYITANMQVIKQAIVGDIKIETAEEAYLADEEEDGDCCHEDGCDCGHHH